MNESWIVCSGPNLADQGFALEHNLNLALTSMSPNIMNTSEYQGWMLYQQLIMALVSIFFQKVDWTMKNGISIVNMNRVNSNPYTSEKICLQF